MKVKSVELAEEITDIDCDTIDVYVESETGYIYTVVVGTPQDLIEEMNQKKTNFIDGRTPTIFVRKLTKEIVTEAILAYAQDDAYWLKLCQFGDDIDISVLNKIETDHREKWELFELEGLDRFFYYFQKYAKVPYENQVLFGPIVFLTILILLAYCLLKPELLDFFFNFIH